MRTLLTSIFRGSRRPVVNPTRPQLVALESREVPTVFSFATINFDDANAPSTYSKLPAGTYSGVVVNTEPTSATVAPVGFPNETGFPPNLAIGSNLFSFSDVRPLNLPANDQGGVNRSGILISYTNGRAIQNGSGDEFLVYESASSKNAVEAWMIQAYNVNKGTWGPWVWEAPEVFQNYVGDPTQGAFGTSIDLSTLGLGTGEYATKFRIVNMMPEDRMVSSSGQGVVIPGDNGATSTFRPRTGVNFSGNAEMTVAGDFDPDPLYSGGLGAVATNISNVRTTVLAVPSPGTSGLSVTYTVTIENLGSGDATGVDPDFTLDTDFTPTNKSTSATGGATGNTVNYNSDLLSLPAGSTVTYIIQGDVAAAATSPLSSTFFGGKPALPMTDPNLADNTTTSELTLQSSGNLVVTMTPDSGNLPAGSPVTYTVTVTNSGPSALTGANVKSIIPAGLTGVTFTSTASGGATGNSPTGSGAINDLVNIGPTGKIVYTVTGTVPPTFSGSVPFQVDAALPTGATGTPGSKTATTTAVLTGDLQVAMTAAPTNPISGGQVKYQITASNPGPSTATGALFTNAFSSAFTNISFTSTANGGATGNSNGIGDINQSLTLPSGASVVYDVTATIAPNYTGLLTNSANLDVPANFTDPNLNNNSKSVQVNVIPGAAVGLTITPNTPIVSLGAKMSYDVEVVNNGPSAVTGVSIASLLDPNIGNVQFTSVASGGANGNSTVGLGNVNEKVNLPQGGKIVYTVFGNVATGISGDLKSTFTTTNPVGVPNPNGDNKVTITTPTQPSPNVIYAASTGFGVVTQVFVFNADGSQRFSYQPYATAFTRGVWCAVGDVNGDGFPDVVTGAASGGGSHVKAVNGLDGSDLFSFFAFGPDVRTGVVVDVQDLNNDGINEIICGSDVGGGPRVRAFDVSKGTPGSKSVADFFAFDPTMNKGVRIASGNVLGSSVPEIIVSAGPGGPSNVNIFDVVTGKQVSTFQPFGNSTRGIYVAAADFNNDGFAEIVCGDDKGSTPTVAIYDPTQNYKLTASFLAYESNFRGGVRVATYADDSVSIADPPLRILTGPGPGGGPRLRKFTGTGGDLGSQFLIGSFDRGGIYVG